MTNEKDKKKWLIIGGAVLAAAMILVVVLLLVRGYSQRGYGHEKVTIVDTINYTGLKVGGEYTITGTLMDKSTGEIVRDASGKEITAEKTFTADKQDGSTTLTYEVDSSLLAGSPIVSFNRLNDQGEVINVDQSIHVPEVTTTEKDKKTTEQETKSDEQDSVKQDDSDKKK